MFSVGWRTGLCATRIVRKSFNSFNTAVAARMGNCNDKQPKVAPNSKQSKVVCKEDEIQEGEMKEFPLGDKGTCLVAKQNGKLYAIGSKCSHYGANLANGALGDGVVTCPWHGACFKLETGDIEDFPGLDSLPKYDVEVENGEVKIHFASTEAKRMKAMAKRDRKNTEVVVVVGGGAAAQETVEALRNRPMPFTGRIVMLTAESAYPYDRIKLSKALTSSAEEIALRPKNFYKEHDIEVMTGAEVVGVDTDNKEVKLNNGDSVKYDHLVLATGAKPRSLPIPGADLPNILILRTPADANQIAALSEGKNLVIVGTSFIGMEVAAALVGKAGSVTVIGNGPYPFAAMGEEIGKFVQALYEDKGIKFVLNSSPEEFVANEDGQLGGLVVAGETIPADVCVLGIGVEATTAYLAGSNIELDGRGNVIVDENLETNVKNVFAAGDVAAVPLRLPIFDDGVSRVNVGHWQLALALGKCAGTNVAAKEVSPVKTVPFFWTVWFGKSIRYAGYGFGYDDIVYDGDVSEGKFVAYYCKGETVVAVATLMRDPIAAHFANLLREGRTLLKENALTEWFNPAE